MMKKKQYTSVTFIKALLLTIVLGLLAYVIDVPAIRISLIGMTFSVRSNFARYDVAAKRSWT